MCPHTSRMLALNRNTSVIPCMLFLPVPRSFSVQEASATIGEKLCVELNQCLSQHGYSPFSIDQKNTLRGQISATMEPDNKVRRLMGKKNDT